MMTWGQLRMQLQTSAPGVSLDLIDEYLTSRYEQVLEANDWTGVKGHSTIETQAAYQSGTDTVTFTVGSSSVTGSGTTWTSAITGQRMYRPGDTVYYTVTYVSATSLTLDRAYEGNGTDAPGTVYSASAYVFMQHIYSLPSDLRAIVSILDPVTSWPLNPMSKDELDASAGPRTNVQNPVYYAQYDDTTDTAPPVIHQVEFYPPPLYARGYTLEYLKQMTFFDGQSTSNSPVPWVSATVILHGCRADIALYLAGQQQTPAAAQPYLAQHDRYEKNFEIELARLLRIEHTQRRQKRPMQMAARFTRHRLARATRALNRNWGPDQGGPN